MSVPLRGALRWLVPAALWLWLCFHLHEEWMLNPRYNYGWAVPGLAIFLLYARRQRAGEAPPARPRPGAAALGWICLALLLPIRLVEEANPDWRLLSWLLAGCVVVYTLTVVFRAGGWRWLRHFAFPICFLFVAVPWPVRLENAIVQGMTRGVAYCAVEMASWLGIAAYQLGNVIQLANGFVGVDEACSGVKTLQTAIMVALFLGELLMLTVSRRVLLLILGCIWVFVCNILRAAALVIIAARRGIPALEQWHDLIGAAVIVLGLGGLVTGAMILSRKSVAALPSRGPATLNGFRGGETLAALVWLALVFAGSEFWYRAHEAALVERPRWEARWPEEAKPQPIAERTASILRYNEASSAAWETGPGIQWWGFFARWKPQRAALQLARSHSPEICLPAAGWTFRRELAPLDVEAGAGALRFRTLEFEQNGSAVFVFACLQEDKTTTAGPRAESVDWNARGRLRAVWRGERNLGQRLLELAVIGMTDAGQARAAVEEAVRGIVRADASPTG